MTLPEFLEKLEQTPRGSWKFIGGRIRTCDGQHCPITAVASWSGVYTGAAKAINLPEELANDIAEAADNGPEMWGKFDAELRAKLLKACGLEAA